MDSFVINVLVWAFCATGVTLIGVLAWLGKGVYGKLSSIENAAQEQFKTFGQQLSAVKDLLTEDIHRHDVRITRLEEWRTARDEARSKGAD